MNKKKKKVCQEPFLANRTVQQANRTVQETKRAI